MQLGERLKDVSEKSLAIAAVTIFATGIGAAALIQEQRISSIRDTHDAELAQLRSEHSGELEQRADDHRAEVEALATDRDELQRRIDQLVTDLSSVDRVVADVVVPLDVGGIVVTDDSLRSLPTELEAYEDGIFALAATELDHGWTHRRTNEFDLLIESAELTDADVAMIPAEVRDTFRSLEVHVWELQPATSVVAEEGSLGLIWPAVTIERVGADELTDIAIGLQGLDDASEDELEALLSPLLTEQPVTGFLQLNLAGELVFTSPSRFTTILAIDSTERAVYVKLLDIYRDVSVGGVRYDEFFQERELIVVRAGDDVVVIGTAVPTSDRRGSAEFSAVTRLLQSLRVTE